MMVEESIKTIELKSCECNCGKMMPKFDSRGRLRKRIIGHNSKGRKFSKETLNKMILSRTGKKLSEKTKQLISINMLGNRNPSWKGENVGYFALHSWLRKHMNIPEICESCNLIKPLDLSNITGIYNRDFNNWAYLCRSCHISYDRRKMIVFL